MKSCVEYMLKCTHILCEESLIGNHAYVEIMHMFSVLCRTSALCTQSVLCGTSALGIQSLIYGHHAYAFSPVWKGASCTHDPLGI